MQKPGICPNCGTSLREGAKFCAKCGSALAGAETAEENASARSASAEKAAVSRQIISQLGGQAPAAARTIPLKNAPVQASVPAGPRPLGSSIAGRCQVTGLLPVDGKLFCYQVVESRVPPGEKTLQCPNPDCGAIHSKAASADPDHYPALACDECNTLLERDRFPALMVREALDPVSLGSAPQVAVLGLIHGSLRAPLFATTEMFGGQPRALVLEPRVDPLPERVEPAQALRWLPGLAAALDYLHFSGVTFRGQVSRACFGRAGEWAVWANFDTCSVIKQPREVSAADRAADVRGLAACLYTCITGREQLAPDPLLTGEQYAFFAQAVSGPGFASGADLIQALEQVLPPGSSEPVELRLGRCTDVGRARKLNEDSILTIAAFNPRPAGVYVVADGMGGHTAGEVASSAIVSSIQERCDAELSSLLLSGAPADWQTWLKTTVELANKHVYDLRKASGTDMGSTMVMALLDGTRAYLAHVGDSRIYLINQRGIRRLTVDHSLVERLVATGQIRPEEAQKHPQKNVIYRTMGDKPNVEVETSMVDLTVGDRLLLCSDGLCGMLLDDAIQKIVMSAADPQAACDALIAAANDAGGEDNISAILVEIVRG